MRIHGNNVISRGFDKIMTLAILFAGTILLCGGGVDF